MIISDILLVSGDVSKDSLTCLSDRINGLLDYDWLWSLSLGLILNYINNFGLFGVGIDIQYNSGLLFSMGLDLNFVSLSKVSY